MLPVKKAPAGIKRGRGRPPKQGKKIPSRIVFLESIERIVDHNSATAPDLFDAARKNMHPVQRRLMDITPKKTIEQRRMASSGKIVSEKQARIRQELKVLQQELDATKSSVKRFNLKAKMDKLKRQL